MKKCLGYSFWGDKSSSYFSGISLNLEIASLYYPDWDFCLFTPTNCLSQDEKRRFKGINNRFILHEVSFAPDWSGMFWRMLPIFMSPYSHLCVRDLDSLISERESVAVNEWISSDNDLHIMRDHPAHTSVIMGGMFGIRCNSKSQKIFKPVKNILMESLSDSHQSYWQIDQDFLAKHVFPEYLDSMSVHDPYYDKISFSCPRSKPHLYVGRPTLRLGEDLHSDDASLTAVDNYLSQPLHSLQGWLVKRKNAPRGTTFRINIKD